jgi:hypothetical protein
VKVVVLFVVGPDGESNVTRAGVAAVTIETTSVSVIIIDPRNTFTRALRCISTSLETFEAKFTHRETEVVHEVASGRR